MSELCINRKKFSIGSVVYFVRNLGNGKYTVWYGIVEVYYPSEVCLQLLEPFDNRRINGIPIKDFEFPSRWQKLPKGWSYDTELFKCENPPLDRLKEFDIKKPDDILEAYKLGLLVKVQDNLHCDVEAEIDKKLGWRIKINYNPFVHRPHLTHTSIRFDEAYKTFEMAQRVVDEYIAEFKRQSELSDYEWSVEQIVHTLNKMPISDLERQRYKDNILAKNNVEDIEVRCIDGRIQWKYWKNKNWIDIVLD